MSDHGTLTFHGGKPCPKCMAAALEENEICFTTKPPIYILRRVCWACGYEERILRDQDSIHSIMLKREQEGEKI